MPLCFGALAIGAGEHEAPIAPVRVRRPDLLTVDDPVVAVEVGARLNVRQVAARIRFGVSLTPQFLAPADLGQESILLLDRTEVDERGADQPFTDVAESTRAAGPCVLLVENDLHVER